MVERVSVRYRAEKNITQLNVFGWRKQTRKFVDQVDNSYYIKLIHGASSGVIEEKGMYGALM